MPEEGSVDDALKQLVQQVGNDADGTPRVLAVAKLPTRSGDFTVVAFSPLSDGREHVALVRGDVVGAADVCVRVHSECLTGDALGSVRCDCRDQLELALDALSRGPGGVLLYLRQEGRGIGLMEKVRAYALQDNGLDTVQANLALGHANDERDYTVAAEMLTALQVQSIRLMTNNPDKVDQLRELGVDVAERVPHTGPVREHNRAYLQTKMERSGHLLDALLNRRRAGK